MDFNKIKELSVKNYMNVFSRQNICFVEGKGNVLIDTANNKYIDFISGIGVNCLGYGNPELVETISQQAGKLIHSSNLYYNKEQTILAENLLDGTIFSKVFLANSGAEANECAIKLVRKYYEYKHEDKKTIITAFGSFHGRTLATLTATGQKSHYASYAPLPPGFKHVPYNDFNALKENLTPDVGAVMLEVIQSRSVITPADYDYLVNVYALCRSKGILFILDEIQTGIGRTGKMFAFEHYGIQPDIITLGKGLGAGLPISAVLARGDVAGAFHIGDHGSTLSGNQLVCAAANLVINKLKNGLLDEINEKGEYLSGKLAYFSKYKFVENIKGLGLLQGIQLSSKINGYQLQNQLLNNGILLNITKKNTIRLLPPFTITLDEIDEMIEKLDDAFAKINL